MERDRRIDLVKTLAIFCVLVIHVGTEALQASLSTFDRLGGYAWASAARVAVPLFFMCSGALLFSEERKLTMKKLYGRNMLRLLIALFFWAIVYSLWDMYRAGTWTGEAFLAAGKDLLLFRHKYHLYYLHIALLFYAMIPVMRILTRSASRKEIRYILILWFITGILFPILYNFWPFTLLGGIPLQWKMNMAWASLGYGLLGWYLKKYGCSLKAAIFSLAAGFVFTFGGTLLLSGDAPDTRLLEGMSPGIALMAFGVFGLCLRAKGLKGKGGRVIEWIGRSSFCVYLVHVLLLELLRDHGMTVLWGPVILTIPLISAGIMAASLLIYAVLSRIPVVRSWLV